MRLRCLVTRLVHRTSFVRSGPKEESPALRVFDPGQSLATSSARLPVPTAATEDLGAGEDQSVLTGCLEPPPLDFVCSALQLVEPQPRPVLS
jgi:hypothetical protein